MHFSAGQFSALQCSAVKCSDIDVEDAVQCSVLLLPRVMHFSAVQYSAVFHDELQGVQYSIEHMQYTAHQFVKTDM